MGEKYGNANTSENSHESERRKYADFVTLQYDRVERFDHEWIPTALFYRGDNGEVWNKWVDGDNAMVVSTAEGKEYFFGKHILIDTSSGETYIAPGTPEITLGDPWVLTVVGENDIEGTLATERIASVLVEYKEFGENDVARKVEGETPFKKVHAALERADRKGVSFVDYLRRKNAGDEEWARIPEEYDT